jgi:uncharacterized phage protein gp47/JayE
MIVLPTIEQRIDNIQADINARLLGADARLAGSDLEILSIALAGGLHETNPLLYYIARQTFIHLADEEGLQRFGIDFNMPRLPATVAQGMVLANGTGTIPSGTIVTRSDGAVYITTMPAILSGGTHSVPVSAVVPSAAGNANPATQMSLQTGIAGVTVTAVDANGLNLGADIEHLENWRARLLNRRQNAAHGGNANDYEVWAREVPGVSRAWLTGRDTTIGRIDLMIANDSAGIVPSAALVAAVRAHIMGTSYTDPQRLAPVGVNALNIITPILAPQNYTVHLIGADTPAIRAAVIAELTDLLVREGKPNGEIPLTHINEAISQAAGEYDHQLLSPTVNAAFSITEVPSMGAVTFV